MIVRIAVRIGMRLSEIATLRIGQEDIERRVVRLEHTRLIKRKRPPQTVFPQSLMSASRCWASCRSKAVGS